MREEWRNKRKGREMDTNLAELLVFQTGEREREEARHDRRQRGEGREETSLISEPVNTHQC